MTCLELPYVIFDYGKCNGDGACTDSCPNSAFELSRDRRWCKPLDSCIRNSEALASFYERVERSNSSVPVAIRYHIPECILCWQCIGSCPNKAIGVEYDNVETREYLIPSGQENFW
jgi:ferredoxin